MANNAFFEKLKIEYKKQEGERRQIIRRANDVLNASKKAIFALHRDDIKGGKASLDLLTIELKNIAKDFGQTRADEEGAYRAATEEYLEAQLLYASLSGKKLDRIAGLKLGAEGYLGGICDLTGELVRRATNEAAAGRFEAVAKIKEEVSGIMAELLDFDLTGYLRTKYDQARTNLRRLEQMAYEINLRR
jgi:predicted translin family RNA/ssDNA-binding protein